jgi:hypothetical protein
MGRDRRFRIDTVRGEPYDVGSRRLIPKARIVSYGRARGTVGHRTVGGWGFAVTKITPLGVLEKTETGERSIAITDATAAVVWALLGTGVAITVMFTAIRWFARRWGSPEI